MKLRILPGGALMRSRSRCESMHSRPVSTTSASEIPHLRKQGTATQLIVDGKPYLALAGELSNNGATSVEYMKPIWSKLVEAKLNTVLAGVSWAQIEPQEGKFDFSVVDGMVRDARSHGLHLVLLWFASWKNGHSSYPPDWLKRIRTVPARPVAGGQEHRTAQRLQRCQPGRRCPRLRGPDAAHQGNRWQQHTVITIQVENEVGMERRLARPLAVANQAYAGPVPKELMDYIEQHKDTLNPEFRQLWQAAGCKTSGTWEEVFGKGKATDEIFMAWTYARYVGQVAEAGKAEYPLPMYMNA